jgi:hypothetical protein
MNRIDLPHLVWAMENLAAGRHRQSISKTDAHFAELR